MADRVALGDLRAQRRQRVPHLRAEDEAGEPGRLLRHQVVELVHPVRGEALRRHPHRRLRVELAEARGLLLEQREHVPRLGVAGIAAGHEDGVDPRQPLEDLGPFLDREVDRRRVGVVLVHRRIPDPDVEAVLVGDARHLDHHLDRRQGKVRAVGVVVRARRNELDGVVAEDRQVADVLLPHRDGPAVVGVGLGPVAELMAAQRRRRRGREPQRRRDGEGAAIHAQLAEQASDAEEDAAFVGARHGHLCSRAAAGRDELKPFGAGFGKTCRRGPGAARQASDAANVDRRPSGGRARGHRQRDQGALLHLFDQHLHGLLLSRRRAGGGHDDCRAEVDRGRSRSHLRHRRSRGGHEDGREPDQKTTTGHAHAPSGRTERRDTSTSLRAALRAAVSRRCI